MAKELPILFNGEMVRAILDGRKTQTRRPVKPQPRFITDTVQGVAPYWQWHPIKGQIDRFASFRLVDYSPFGGIGTHLYVRETHQLGIAGCPSFVTYRADHIDPRGDGPAYPIKWRPSIHMPKWASRITLEVTREWMERVQKIAYEDVKAEGVMPEWNERSLWYDAFRETWDSLYATKGFGWDSNPWVFGCGFKLLEVRG